MRFLIHNNTLSTLRDPTSYIYVELFTLKLCFRDGMRKYPTEKLS